MSTLRIFPALFVWLLLMGISPADALRESIRKQAEENVQAQQTGDVDTILKYTCPEMLKQAGGKEEAFARTKAKWEKSQTRDLKIPPLEIGEPRIPVNSGERMFSVVPNTMTIVIPDGPNGQEGGTTIHHGFQLAISEDQGQNWTFLDLTFFAMFSRGLYTEEIRKFVGGLPPDFPLPPKEDFKMITIPSKNSNP